jgi:ATP-dependent DNA helicase RecG
MPNLDSKITSIPRVNAKYADALGRLNIRTVRDLLFHFPFRYEDYSERIQIENLEKGMTATIMGTVISCKLTRTWKKKIMIVEAHIQDETETIRAVWFNQPYISDQLAEGRAVRLSGKVSEDSKGIYFSNPAWERSSREPTNTGRLVPIYPETEGITSRWLRWQIQGLIKLAEEIKDPIPEKIISELHLPELRQALQWIHFPQDEKQYLIAQKRFAFQDMLLMQLASLRARNTWEKEKAASIKFDEKLIKSFVDSLPFTLTDAQKKSAFQIFQDMEKARPMNRLLNGDVGSGKTVVAALAALSATNSKYQTVIMAPTEVLARQHFESFCKLFSGKTTSIALLTNSYRLTNNLQLTTGNLQREDLLNKIKLGNINIIIGTHALIQKGVRFKNLALVVVDEQHRFGVQQRAYLQKEIANINDGLPGKIPHLLSMTATPIPRTLTLAFFGDLDLSILDEMPKNRKPIITKIVLPSKRDDAHDFIRSEIAKGRQAFIIFPLVEESSKLTELKAATQEHERLSRDIFPELKLGLLHGKLKAVEKEHVMQDFKDKKYDILVATSVVEVGIDVPNASVIMIEDADRFGLSQLHQFRGRVGRGEYQSYCFLLTGKGKSSNNARLKALEKNVDGFAIAEEDLKLRGPGQFFGTQQSGLPDIAMQHIANVKLIEISRKYAQEILTGDLSLRKHGSLKKDLERFATNVHME